ncbi:MAG: 3-dehydroquinate synthase [Nitrospirae bacterium]|nr:3-dehydroquinate synthase [Nitrospirota bacterium]
MRKIEQQFTVNYRFPVIFTRDVFNINNTALCDVLKGPGEKKNRILIVIDSNVSEAMPGLIEKLEKYSKHNDSFMEFVASPFIIRGGEACKKDSTEVDKLHGLIDKHHLCRHSFVLVIGGGAVLDAAGYSAATAHRGIRLIRMPTTTLAQNDAGVGVKNGINAFCRKNFLGTFAPPFAIINDFDFLATLPERELRSGISEAVKVALIKDRAFFDLLYNERQKLAVFAPDVMEKMIIRCAELHIEHIGMSGDPFEYGSSRPLDFGHWSAHKIEELTGGKIQHGEAVAIGIALDSLYSHHTGLISEIELHKIFSALEDIGFDLYHWSLSWIDINSALKEFQEHLGGELTIPMLKGIGGRIEVHEIDTVLLKKCVNILAERSREKESKNDYGKFPDAGETGIRTILP